MITDQDLIKLSIVSFILLVVLVLGSKLLSDNLYKIPYGEVIVNNYLVRMLGKHSDKSIETGLALVLVVLLSGLISRIIPV